MKRHNTLLLCALLACIVFPYPLRAQPDVIPAEPTFDELFEISLAELMEIPVTIATKHAMPVHEAPSIVSVITSRDIENMGARDLVDVLRIIPGFDITMDPLVYHFNSNVRGFDAEDSNIRAKIFIDGHEPIPTWGTLSCIPIANIDRIEIIRGPGSALYGGSAFLCVINIITKTGASGQSRISFEGGSYETISPTGEWSYQKGALKAHFLSQFKYSNGYAGLVESDAAGNAGNMDLNSLHYTFQSKAEYKDTYALAYFQKIDTGDPTNAAYRMTDETEQKTVLAFTEIGQKFPFANTGELTVKSFYDYVRIDYNHEVLDENTSRALGAWEGESFYGNPRFEEGQIGGEITYEQKVLPYLTLLSGASYKYYERFDVEIDANFNGTGSTIVIDGNTYTPLQYMGYMRERSDVNWNISQDRHIISAYGEEILDIKKLFNLTTHVESLSLTAGLRYDHYSNVGTSFTPRCGIVYKPNEKTYVKVLFGQAFRPPTFTELGNKNNQSFIGNPNLNAEKLSTTEISIGHHLSKHMHSDITLFDIYADDLIAVVNANVTNVGKANSRGIEWECKAAYDSKKYLYANATYQLARDTTHKTITSSGGKKYTHDDYYLGNVPKILFNAGINCDFFEAWNAHLWLNYTGRRKRSGEKQWSGEELVMVDTRGATPSRYLLNASLIYHAPINGLQIQASVYNLLDEDHRDPDSSRSLAHDLPQPGRNYSLKVSYTF